MNTPAQCGVIKPPKTDIYSEAPQDSALTVLDTGLLTCWNGASTPVPTGT